MGWYQFFLHSHLKVPICSSLLHNHLQYRTFFLVPYLFFSFSIISWRYLFSPSFSFLHNHLKAELPNCLFCFTKSLGASYLLLFSHNHLEAVLRIRDVYPGSRILIFTHPGSRIPDPGSRIPDPGSKNSNKKNCQKALKNMVLGSGIRDPESGIRKKPIPDPGSRIQGSKRIPIPDPGSGSATLLGGTSVYLLISFYVIVRGFRIRTSVPNCHGSGTLVCLYCRLL
jgi:hypothetical protein